MFTLGCLAFVFFFLSDINDRWLHRRALLPAFPAGFAALAVALAFQLRPSQAPVSWTGGRVLFWAGAAFFVVLLLRALFFIFPAAPAYTAPGERRPVCRTGPYALCRHPGVLWLSCALCCLWAGAGLPPLAAAVYTLLNILLALFEDLLVFPALLAGYADYRRETPFLFPTPHSVDSAMKSLRKRDRT